MEQNDKVEFAKTVTAMAAHKRQTLSVLDHRFWWEGMQDWSLADFQAAAFQLVKTKEFMPSMKDFEDLRKAGRMTAGEAFAKAVEWAKSGAYRHPSRSPAAIMIDRVVAALGGWDNVASHDAEKLHFLEKRFSEHFETIQDASDTRAALPQITNAALQPRLAASLKMLTNT